MLFFFIAKLTFSSLLPTSVEEWVALFTIALDFESCVLTLSSAQRLEAGRQAERRQQDGVLPVIWLGLACIVAVSARRVFFLLLAVLDADECLASIFIN